MIVEARAGERIVFKPTGIDGVLGLEVDGSTTKVSMVHTGVALATVLAGTGTWRYRRWRRSARPGIIMCFEAGNAHTTTAIKAPASYRTLFVEDSVVEYALRGHRGAGRLPPAHFDVPEISDPALVARMRAAHQALVSPDMFPGQKLDLLVAILADVFAAGSHVTSAPDLDPGSEALTSAYRRIRADFEESSGGLTGGRIVSVSALAQEMNQPPVGFIRAFERAFGVSPYRYVTALRIARARRLIAGGPRPELPNLTSVAAEAGYFDASHFIRHFKRQVGVAPLQYAMAVDPRWRRGYAPSAKPVA